MLIALLLFSLVFTRSDGFCPSHCTCTVKGVSGVTARCIELNLQDQFFLKPVQHLSIENENRSFSLTDNIFSRLGLTSVESIKIANSSLADINVNAFQGLSSLFDVNLAHNRIFLIHPDTFANNTNLRCLKLSGNPLQLTQLLQTPHDYFLRSSTLTELDLSSCQLSQILPLTFSQTRNLVFVNLSNNFLRSVPRNVFEDLQYLEELDLSHNYITDIEKDMFVKNKELSVLKLKKNPMQLLRGLNVSRLEDLDMSGCRLSVLMRETLEGMPKLIWLNLSHNQLEILSEDAFCDLKDLQDVDMSYNSLTGPLPQFIFEKNQRLSSLNLAGNPDLKVLVQGGFIGNRILLSRLDVSSCGLTALTNDQFQGLDGLHILYASNNSIRTLSNTVFHNMTQLDYLDLSDNLIETLDPELFKRSTQLTVLKLNGNPIMELPVLMFVPLQSLQTLEISNCDLVQLWDHHKHLLKEQQVLSHLTDMDLSQNNIRTLHIYDFSSMLKLQKVSIRKNPLECVKSTLEVIEWFASKQIEPYMFPEKMNQQLDYGAEIVAGADVEEKKLWNEIINEICPIRVKEPKIEIDEELEREHNFVADVSSTFSVHEVILKSDASPVWNTIFMVSGILLVIYLLAYVATEVVSRRRNAAYIKTGPHVFGRANGRAPMYYKLYEECSVPTQQVPRKKNIVVSFTPIHTFLKKGAYKVMNNEADV